MARELGLRIKRVGITWRGPYIVRESGTPNANVLVSAAGPWVNLVLAALLWQSCYSFAFANLVLGLSNLMPTPNSDGRRIWRELTLRRNSERRAST
jgi:Zn-dependent protease